MTPLEGGVGAEKVRVITGALWRRESCDKNWSWQKEEGTVGERHGMKGGGGATGDRGHLFLRGCKKWRDTHRNHFNAKRGVGGWGGGGCLHACLRGALCRIDGVFTGKGKRKGKGSGRRRQSS